MDIRQLQNKDIYLYGAGSYGKILLNTLQENGIQVAGFIDRYAHKIGRFEGLQVYPPEHLNELTSGDALVILATNNPTVADAMAQAAQAVNSEVPLLRNGFALGRSLRMARCKEKVEAGASLDLGDCVGCGSEDHDCEVCIAYLKQCAKPRLPQYGSRKYDRIGYIMGQFCTLRCQYCFEGVPRIEHPVFTKKETILKDVQKFANACYFLKYVELIGGEPFLHPEIKQVIRGLLNLENIGYLQIFTNGTIPPDEELIELLKSPRIIIQVSDYYDFVNEQQKKKIVTTKQLYVQHGIQHKFIVNSDWMDMNCFEPLEKSRDEVSACLQKCVLANCHRLFQGRLYKCPHQYAGVQQNKLGLLAGEYVDIHAYTDQELAAELDRLKAITYLEACRHCSIMDKPQIVPPGEQLL